MDPVVDDVGIDILLRIGYTLPKIYTLHIADQKDGRLKKPLYIPDSLYNKSNPLRPLAEMFPAERRSTTTNNKSSPPPPTQLYQLQRQLQPEEEEEG